MQDAGGLEAGMKELRRLMEAWNAWRQRVERQTAEVEACRTELAVLAGQERVLAEELDNAEASFTELAARYEEWLRQRGCRKGCHRTACRISSPWRSRAMNCSDSRANYPFGSADWSQSALLMSRKG